MVLTEPGVASSQPWIQKISHTFRSPESLNKLLFYMRTLFLDLFQIVKICSTFPTWIGWGPNRELLIDANIVQIIFLTFSFPHYDFIFKLPKGLAILFIFKKKLNCFMNLLQFCCVCVLACLFVEIITKQGHCQKRL